jgi:hypothetical protein
MESLSKSQCWNLPNNEITAQNRYWRNLVKLKDPGWVMECLKKSQDINKYIIKNIPELAYQFRWEQMSDNERLQEKFKYRSAPTYHGHYDGYEIQQEYEED